MLISGWANYPRAESRFVTARDFGDLARKVARPGVMIARGAGRTYGDAAIGMGTTLSTCGLDRMIEIDRNSGQLTVEAGVLLADILDAFIPRGLFPPVVPGTQFVTVGGMVAANVHGKNHHKAGSFGNYVERFTLVLADGSEQVCSPAQNTDTFRATIAGMGLTGVIRDVTFRLQPIASAYVRNETLIADNLDAAIDAFERSRDWTYAVAWIDCLARGRTLGRSILFRGEHARRDELDTRQHPPYARSAKRRPTLPFYFPGFTLNRWTVGAFNRAYFNRQRSGARIVPIMNYFFPLDGIDQWNRIYGRRGFVQHQCVIPKAASRDALGEILELVSTRGQPSFLAVLKLLGPDDAGLLSFPLEGYTLALDFPASESSFQLLQRIDRCVMKHGGRIYLAKDARQDPALLEAGYPKLMMFRDIRRRSGSSAKFKSLQSERLGL
jgi:decaprenylphospho-beta-D-ribofuranose 2-oxidase